METQGSLPAAGGFSGFPDAASAKGKYELIIALADSLAHQYFPVLIQLITKLHSL
jgi:hypothetical protein